MHVKLIKCLTIIELRNLFFLWSSETLIGGFEPINLSNVQSCSFFITQKVRMLFPFGVLNKFHCQYGPFLISMPKQINEGCKLWILVRIGP